MQLVIDNRRYMTTSINSMKNTGVETETNYMVIAKKIHKDMISPFSPYVMYSIAP